MKQVEKTKQYDVIKFIGMILVVVAHCARMYSGGVVTPLNPSESLKFLVEFIYDYHMRLYMMAAGMVYGFCVIDRDKYRQSLIFLKNKGLRLILPYLFWGVAMVAPVMVGFGFTSQTFGQYLVDGILLTNNCRHLWFLVALFEIFIVCALIRKWITKMPPVAMSAVFLVLALLCYLQTLVYLAFHLNDCAYYLVFFYLGFLYNRYFEKVLKVLRHPLTILVCVAAQIALYPVNIWVVDQVKALAGSAAVIGLSAYVTEWMSGKKWFQVLQKNGFGIYLMHPMIIYVLYYYLGPKDIHPWLLFTGVTLVSYFVPVGISMIFRKMRLNILLGE